MDILLSHGADINAQDVDGMTALMTATRYGHVEIVKTLLRNHADIAVKNAYGSDAFQIAKALNHDVLVDLLRPFLDPAYSDYGNVNVFAPLMVLWDRIVNYAGVG